MSASSTNSPNTDEQGKGYAIDPSETPCPPSPEAESINSSDDWGNCKPNPDLDLATIDYWIKPGDEFQKTSTEVTRAELKRVLQCHYFIRRYIRSNLAILQKYGKEGLSATAPIYDNLASDTDADTVDELDTAQRLFAQNHAGIHETLADWPEPHKTFGLPSADYFRSARNWFSHSFLTPHGRFELKWGWHLEGTRELYERTLEIILLNVEILERQLKDEEVWVSTDREPVVQTWPEPVEPVVEVELTPEEEEVRKAWFWEKMCRDFDLMESEIADDEGEYQGGEEHDEGDVSHGYEESAECYGEGDGYYDENAEYYEECAEYIEAGRENEHGNDAIGTWEADGTIAADTSTELDEETGEKSPSALP